MNGIRILPVNHYAHPTDGVLNIPTNSKMVEVEDRAKKSMSFN